MGTHGWNGGAGPRDGRGPDGRAQEGREAGSGHGKEDLHSESGSEEARPKDAHLGEEGNDSRKKGHDSGTGGGEEGHYQGKKGHHPRKEGHDSGTGGSEESHRQAKGHNPSQSRGEEGHDAAKEGYDSGTSGGEEGLQSSALRPQEGNDSGTGRREEGPSQGQEDDNPGQDEEGDEPQEDRSSQAVGAQVHDSEEVRV